MYATVSLPPVPVLQVFCFQHLSARARLTFLSARPRPASAMLRDVGFFGSRVALKSVRLRVLAFAVYPSPKPPPLPTMTGPAPEPDETIARDAASTTSSATASITAIPRRLRPPHIFPPCIVPPFASLSSCLRPRQSWWLPFLRSASVRGRGAS